MRQHSFCLGAHRRAGAVGCRLQGRRTGSDSDSGGPDWDTNTGSDSDSGGPDWDTNTGSDSDSGGPDWDTNTGSDSDPCFRNCATHADASRVGAGGCDRRCRVAGGVGDHAGGAPTRVIGPALPGSRHRDAVRIRVGWSPPILDEKHALSVGHGLDRLGLRGGRNIRGGTGFPSRHGRFGCSPRQSRRGSTVRDGNQRRRGGGPRLGGKRSGVLRRDHRRTIRLLKAPAPTGGEWPDHGFSLSS